MSKNKVSRMLLLLSASALLLLSGCVVITSSAISQARPMSGGHVVHVTTHGMGFLHLTAPNGLTAKANSALLARCGGAGTTDVQTQLSMRDILGIVQIYKIRASAHCL